jgi:GT2 family glycosyltransferase
VPTNVSQRVLRVQSVLFGHEPAQLWRLLRGLSASAHKVVDAGLVGRVEWALGDSGPTPTLIDSDAQSMLDATSGFLSGVTYEFFDANLGSSGGQNHLAKGNPSDLLLVLNPDTYPSPTALVEMVKAFDKFQAGITEARQIPLEHPRYYDPVSGETSWASGFCMLVRRKLFDELEGFDSKYFLLHCDDVDFSWRVRGSGYKVVLAPYATVFHDKRPRPDNAWPAPEVEIYHASLGRLMLATRWGRPDIVSETIAFIESDGSQVQRAALDEFHACVKNGRVPDVEPDAKSVAEFVGGEYAVHRF